MTIKFLVAVLTFVAGVSISFFLRPAVSISDIGPQPTGIKLVALGDGCCPVAAKRPYPSSVLDYYLLLPDSYFEADREQRINWMLDQKRGAIIDFEHEYLYAPGDGAQTNIYVRLFERAHQPPIVAVKYYASDSHDFTCLNFFEYRDGGLVPVNLSPVKLNEKFRIDLPRSGDTIQVRNAHGAPLYDLVWSRTKFALSRH